MHVICDLALYIGENENCFLSRAGQQVKEFTNVQTRDCKRIFLHQNQNEYLPNDLVGSKVVSLNLSKYPLSNHVAQSVFHGLTYLQVLDLSKTGMASVPKSLSQLTSLEFLSLSHMHISNFHPTIRNLPRLQFLDLSLCYIISLPLAICNLSSLQDLNLLGLENLVIPIQISQLTSLKGL